VTGLELRPAAASDAALLWEWRNEEVTRLNSLNPTPIPWTSHVTWFERRLANDGCRIWILEADARPVGQVRFERQDVDAMVNYSIDPHHRGRGLGTAILKLSVPQACRELGTRAIAGVVKTSNLASCRAFASAGFMRTAEVLEMGCACTRFERPCGSSSDSGLP
jgi:UDP-2,4-diacetamido-2,4,6-trideoxy-beta-L-altropyranose hydrolase